MIGSYWKTARILAALALLASLPAPAGAGIVGDADGDGRFALPDLLLVQQALAADISETGPDGLSDVAEPCGTLDQADAALLAKALQGQPLRMTVPSPCHGGDLGTEAPEFTPTVPVTLDDVFWDIAQQVPEFGGLYFDEQGQATVVLTNVGALADAEQAVFEILDHERLGTDMLTPVEGDYGFIDLQEWRKAGRDVLGLDGVTGLDVDEVSNRVWVGLEDERFRRDVEAYLDAAGVRLEAVTFEVTGTVELDAPAPAWSTASPMARARSSASVPA